MRVKQCGVSQPKLAHLTPRISTTSTRTRRYATTSRRKQPNKGWRQDQHQKLLHQHQQRNSHRILKLLNIKEKFYRSSKKRWTLDQAAQELAAKARSKNRSLVKKSGQGYSDSKQILMLSKLHDVLLLQLHVLHQLHLLGQLHLLDQLPPQLLPQLPNSLPMTHHRQMLISHKAQSLYPGGCNRSNGWQRSPNSLRLHHHPALIFLKMLTHRRRR